jgi:AcrR family transcriptional regulator
MPPSQGRAALLDAGLALFAERGFDGASTRAIAVRAGVPQGLVRHHFGSKEGLFREVVDRALSAIEAGLGAPRPAPAQLASSLQRAAPQIALVLHALLEPGARRAWLVEQRLRPLLQRSGPALAGLLGRSAPLAERDLLALVGAVAAPLLLAPLRGSEPAAAITRPLERMLGQTLEALLAPAPVAGPWAPRRLAAAAR